MFDVFADGSVRNGNPGLGGIGVFVKHDGASNVSFTKIIGENKTNNEAEYEAVIAAIEYLKEINVNKEKCIITVDSLLIHGHVVRNWKCNFEHLRILRDRIWGLLKEIPFEVELKWVKRWDNEIANELAQAATEKENLARRG